jgi:hypothetical protein
MNSLWKKLPLKRRYIITIVIILICAGLNYWYDKYYGPDAHYRANQTMWIEDLKENYPLYTWLADCVEKKGYIAECVNNSDKHARLVIIWSTIRYCWIRNRSIITIKKGTVIGLDHQVDWKLPEWFSSNLYLKVNPKTVPEWWITKYSYGDKFIISDLYSITVLNDEWAMCTMKLSARSGWYSN